MKELEYMKKSFDEFCVEADKFIEEHEMYLSWEQFHKKHPEVDKWKWEQKQKELQEV
ncbi:MAG: hypothetical protein J6S67_11070 [Methanobrevibacter sp.]|nr:hypothetical protein [Methanobrevibacter sp.]